MIWTGEISTSQNGEEVEWRIFDFFGLSEKHSLGYSSPDFHVGDDRWNLVIFPNGQSEHDTYGHVDLELCKKSAATYVIQKFSLSLKTVKGEKENEKECAEMFDSWDYHSILRFIPRSELSRRRFELVPDGVLTVICTMKNWAYAESSRHKENSERRGVDATTQTEQNKIAIEKLLHDMKRMMVRGDHSDVTLSVRGEEFRLHRNILGSRNSYFSSIFNDESQEPTPATLPIDDCDPHQFRTLIHFIYTGTADNLCPENVCGLYEVAVAYQEQHMKSDCLQLMMNTLSVDNFCDYTALALKNQEKELLQKAAKLLGRKTKEIIRHEKWEAFLERYPEQASELYMKALDQFGEK